jgi:hypothetical protein
VTAPSGPEEDHPASVVLRQLGEGGSPSVPFGEVAAAAGSRVHGFALLIFVLPETIPLPLPSVSAILGIPLVLISAHLAIFGEGSRWPARLERLHIPRSVIAGTAHYVSPVLERFEGMSRRRWAGLVRRERLIGLLCLYLSLILLLPLPLVNLAPALCIAAISLGLIQRDGRFIAIGIAGTVALTAALVWLVLAVPSFISFMTGGAWST